MTRVLVTGSQGYIGSVLTRYLSEAGYDCAGYDTGFFRDCLLYAPHEIPTVTGDVRDITDADLSGIDAVVHLAGISNDPMGHLDAAQIYDPTRAYTFDLAKRCKRLGVKFVFASSCSVYGVGSEDLLTESSDVNPQTPYSLNKLQVEQDLRSLSGPGFSPVALRFATVFGPSPRLRFDIVVNMLTGMAVADGKVVLNSDGRSWRPNVHILDACQAIKLAIDLDDDSGELLILNIGDERNNLQVIHMAETIQQLVPGCELKFLADAPELDREGLIRDRKISAGVDTRTYRVSFERARSMLRGFACRWTVSSGVKDMAALFASLPLDSTTFKRRSFYRLQQLEHLYETGQLSADLRWQSPQRC